MDFLKSRNLLEYIARYSSSERWLLCSNLKKNKLHSNYRTISLKQIALKGSINSPLSKTNLCFKIIFKTNKHSGQLTIYFPIITYPCCLHLFITWQITPRIEVILKNNVLLSSVPFLFKVNLKYTLVNVIK